MIGMLWFDNDPKAGLEVKIERAVTYYRTKYGVAVNLVYINPRDGEAGTLDGVTVKTSKQVLRNHMLVGEAG